MNTDYIMIIIMLLAAANMEYYAEPRVSLMPMCTGVLCSLLYWNGFTAVLLIFFLAYTSFFYLLGKGIDRR